MAIYSEALIQEIKRLYYQGMSTREIGQAYGVSRSTVERWMSGFSGVGKLAGKEQTVAGGITPQQIAAVRKKARIGSRIMVRTWKCQDIDSQSFHTGCRRKAKVIDNTHPRFCTIEYSGGVRESVLWVELIMNKR